MCPEVVLDDSVQVVVPLVWLGLGIVADLQHFKQHMGIIGLGAGRSLMQRFIALHVSSEDVFKLAPASSSHSSRWATGGKYGEIAKETSVQAVQLQSTENLQSFVQY